MSVEYLSFGAGPPSVALMILNAWGEIQPKAELIVFADTGSEKERTYDLLPEYESWASEMSMDWQTVYSKDGPLLEYITEKSFVIPVHTENAIGHRQCTDKWKIEPIERYLHGRFGQKTPLIAQIAYHWGEAHRVRDPKVKRNKNRFPLIEKRLNRQQTIDIIKLAGLTVPPWSACYFCPLQNDARWREVASRSPEDFQKAVELDNFLRTKNEKGNRWLHWSRRPLGNIYSTSQTAFPFGDDGLIADGGVIEECSDGNCHT